MFVNQLLSLRQLASSVSINLNFGQTKLDAKHPVRDPHLRTVRTTSAAAAAAAALFQATPLVWLVWLIIIGLFQKVK